MITALTEIYFSFLGILNQSLNFSIIPEENPTPLQYVSKSIAHALTNIRSINPASNEIEAALTDVMRLKQQIEVDNFDIKRISICMLQLEMSCMRSNVPCNMCPYSHVCHCNTSNLN